MIFPALAMLLATKFMLKRRCTAIETCYDEFEGVEIGREAGRSGFSVECHIVLPLLPQPKPVALTINRQSSSLLPTETTFTDSDDKPLYFFFISLIISLF